MSNSDNRQRRRTLAETPSRNPKRIKLDKEDKGEGRRRMESDHVADDTRNSGTLNSRNGRVAKKLVIKKFHNRDDHSVFEANWSLLEEAVVNIQEKKPTQLRYEALFNAVVSLCSSGYEELTYSKANRLFNGFLDQRLNLLLASENFLNSAFLESLNKVWLDYCNQLGMVQSLFTHLDRTYVIQNPNILAIWESGLNVFKEIVIDCPKISDRLIPEILKVIQIEREGEPVDRTLLKSIISIFIKLKIYGTTFEHELVKATQSYYNNESRRLIEELDVSAYLKYVSKRLEDEAERVNFYLSHESLEILQSCVDTCFVENFMQIILNKGAEEIFIQNKTEDIKLMYRVFGRIKNGHLNLKNSFVAYIKKVGKVMVANLENEKSLVQDLMKFKSGVDKTINECFDENEKFIQGEKDAFDYFINTRPNKPAELIAKYMDSKLRSGNKECSEDELDAIMDSVIILFRFIQGKDVFEAFYKKSLAKRLLMGRSASVDSEKAMLSKLKNECGSGFTQKLEGMFKDMEISKELSNTFCTYRDSAHKNLAGTEFEVSVLTMGHWPTYPPMNVKIPQELQSQEECFEKFYTSKHNGRKLQWQHSLASAILKANFTFKVRKELDVSMFQALILLLFNERSTFDYPEILEKTGIEAVELKRTLQSLACGKYRVLTKEPKGKDIGESDQFIFNDKFNDKHYRIRISQVLMKETESEHKQTEEQVNQDRQYQIDAAIVRIMKMRKVLAHNLLLTELFDQLRFPAKPVDLKKRIESLIEREYMVRDKADAQLYNYMA